MNKFLKAIGIIVIITVLVCTFASCVKEPLPVNESDKIYIIIIDGEETTVLERNAEEGFLIDALEAFQNDGELTFTTSGEGDSEYLLTIGTLSPNSANSEFIAVYTDVPNFYNEIWGTIEVVYDTETTVTFCSATNGIGSLPIQGECTYIFTIPSY